MPVTVEVSITPTSRSLILGIPHSQCNGQLCSIENQSGCRIKVLKDTDTLRFVGPQSSIETAKLMVEKSLQELTPVTHELKIDDIVAKIITTDSTLCSMPQVVLKVKHPRHEQV